MYFVKLLLRKVVKNFVPCLPLYSPPSTGLFKKCCQFDRREVVIFSCIYLSFIFFSTNLPFLIIDHFPIGTLIFFLLIWKILYVLKKLLLICHNLGRYFPELSFVIKYFYDGSKEFFFFFNF